MSNVASLELCKELYELSGWFGTYANYYLIDGIGSLRPAIKTEDSWPGNQLVLEAPAYDLGYLIRKLPENKAVEYSDENGWAAIYDDRIASGVVVRKEAKTPEDALCKLCIELIKQKVITPHE